MTTHGVEGRQVTGVCFFLLLYYVALILAVPRSNMPRRLAVAGLLFFVVATHRTTVLRAESVLRPSEKDVRPVEDRAERCC